MKALDSDRWINLLDHPLVDWPIVAIVTVIAEWPFGLWSRLADAPPAAQRAAFGTEASLFGIIAGFTVTSMFAFASSDNYLTRRLRRYRGALINRTLVGSFTALVLSALATAAAVLSAPGLMASWLAGTACILAVAKLARVSFVAWGTLATAVEVARIEPKKLPPSSRRDTKNHVA